MLASTGTELGKTLGFTHRKEGFEDGRTEVKGDSARGHSIFIFPEQEAERAPTTHGPRGKGQAKGLLASLDVYSAKLDA